MQHFIDPRKQVACGVDGSGFIHRNEEIVVFGDAQIHNRAELCRALDDRSLPEKTDGALILASWRRWREDAAHRIIGDFAFFVHDPRDGTVFAARDPSGTVPCWYAATSNGLLVASSPQPILDAPGFEGRPDENAVAEFVLSGIDGHARTMTHGLFRLPPGAYLTFDCRGGGTGRREPHISHWWRPEQFAVDTTLDAETVTQQLGTLLHQAIVDRLPAQGGVGLHVSGGLDSTFIALTAARAMRERGHTAPRGYSWQTAPGAETVSAEHGRILATARLADIPLRFEPVSASDILECLSLDPFRQPVTTLDHELPVMRAAVEDGVKVMLSGWGGDEVATFNGRGLYPYLLRTMRWGPLIRAAREDGGPFLRFLLGAAVRPLIDQWLEQTGLRAPAHEARRASKCVALAPDFRRRIAVPAKSRPPFDPKGTQRWLLSNGHIVDRIESWAVAGSQRGLTYRYPMLDRRLLEFALTIPVEHFRSPAWNRLPMRHALDRIGGAEIAWAYAKNEPERVEFSTKQAREAYRILNRRLLAGEPLANGQWIDHSAVRKALVAVADGTSETGLPTNTAMRAFARALHLLTTRGP